MTILPSLGHAFHTGAPVSVFVHFYPKIIYYLLFIVQTPLFSSHYIICRHRWRPALFWPHATHVTLGWSITSHLPLPASSISSEYPTGQLPLPSEFVHLAPPLAQLNTSPDRPPDTRPCYTVAATVFLIHPPAKGSLESSHFLTSSMYLCHFFTSVDSTEPFFFSESRFPFVDISTLFQKGNNILILIPYFNERSRTAQGETPLLPAVVGPHNIRCQHSLMLWWVLLCDYCSYFLSFAEDL
jgi:hypothetical protein